MRAWAVVLALAVVAVVATLAVLAALGVFSKRPAPAPRVGAAVPSAPAATALDAPLSVAEEAQVGLVALDHTDEADAASGFEAIQLFAGMAYFAKGANRGIVAEMAQGLVHEIALSCISAEGLRAPLKILSVLEMAYQCSDATGDFDATGCASSGVFLAIQLGMMWKEKGASRAVSQWFKAAFKAG